VDLDERDSHAGEIGKSAQSLGKEKEVMPHVVQVKWKKANPQESVGVVVGAVPVLQLQETTLKRMRSAGQFKKCSGLYEDEVHGLYWVPERPDEL
jgi:hypothetical protein